MGQYGWSFLPPWLFVAVPAELVSLPIPILLPLTARLEQFGKRAGNVRISLDEPPVEVDEAQEYLDIVNTLRLGPLGHRFHPFGIHACALPAHYKAQEFDFRLEERAFFKIGIKAKPPESLKDFSDVSPVILQIL
jgi:hypothetical protein